MNSRFEILFHDKRMREGLIKQNTRKHMSHLKDERLLEKHDVVLS